MATAARYNRTALLRTGTVTVEVWDTPPRCMAWRIGIAAVRFGVWLLGFGGFRVQVNTVPGAWTERPGGHS